MLDFASNSTSPEPGHENIQIPQRSRLYFLKPQQLNSVSTESLTGYISRLAQVHNLFPGTLMESILAPLVNKAYGGANLHRIYSYTSTLNGTGTMAFDLVQALQRLTMQNNLQTMTMLPWAEVIPARHLLRSNRAWCPMCYEDWQSNRQIVYDPLIWTIAVITVCPWHRQPLMQQCPHCSRSNLTLAWRSRPGYCSKCQGWLGSSQNNFDGSSLSKQNLEWSIWAAITIRDLLAAAPSLTAFPTSQRIADTLHFYVDRVTSGNIAEFARQLRVPKNTFWLWYQGNNLPTLESLVRICYGLKVPLTSFLTADLPTAQQEQIVSLPTPRSSKRANATIFTAAYLQSIQQHLQDCLESGELPPPSMKDVAKRLGHDRRTIYKHFSELCHAISARYDAYQQACHLEAVEQACAEIRSIVPKLLAEPLYPSEARVSQQMTKPGHLRYEKVRAALRDAKAVAGLR